MLSNTQWKPQSLLGMCRKPKFGSYLVFKNRTVQNLTSVQMVFRQKLHAICHSNKKLIEVTLLASNVHIKNVLKHNQNRI